MEVKEEPEDEEEDMPLVKPSQVFQNYGTIAFFLLCRQSLAKSVSPTMRRMRYEYNAQSPRELLSESFYLKDEEDYKPTSKKKKIKEESDYEEEDEDFGPKKKKPPPKKVAPSKPAAKTTAAKNQASKVIMMVSKLCERLCEIAERSKKP